MASQLMLFETIQTANGDGSFTIRPKRVETTQEIGWKRAAKIIGVKSKKSIYRLCELGEEHGGLKAWKLPTERGNGKWRIDWQSCVTYKERRERQMRAAG